MDHSEDAFTTPQLERRRQSDLTLACGAGTSARDDRTREFPRSRRLANVFGFAVLELGSNGPRNALSNDDVRRDGTNHSFALFPVVGAPVIIHGGGRARLSAGDVALVDGMRPVAFSDDAFGEPWNVVSLQLPRQALVSHLGYEPRGGIYHRSGTPAARLMLELIRNGDEFGGSASSPAESYMQLAVYDLLGALFAPSAPWSTSPHAEKVFTRIKNLIKSRLADPDFGPAQVAAEAGISLRYVQKLFTQHGATCSEFIYSRRLEHAARLLHRRALLRTGQSLSEIAYGSGFRDYTHFARRFRRRFGYAPGAGCKSKICAIGT